MLEGCVSRGDLLLLLQDLGCMACGTWNLVVGLLLDYLAGRALRCHPDCTAAKIRMPFIFFCKQLQPENGTVWMQKMKGIL